MKMLHSAVCGLLLASLAGHSAWADVLNMPTGQKSLEFVTVGDAGNAMDTRFGRSYTGYPTDPEGYGAVGYTYQIGKFDVTAAQYCQFLNAVAAVSDPYGLYKLQMGSSQSCGIRRNGSAGNYTYTLAKNPDLPAERASWADAARFCNWLSNGQGGPETTETGAYTLNGAMSDADLMAVVRNPDARYVIPTQDEWYKAAYYKGGGANAGYWLYPTKSDSKPSNLLSSTGTNNANYCDNYVLTDPVDRLTPVGYFANSPGPYGTFDQGGDVWQWNEARYPIDTSLNLRGIRGGGYADTDGVVKLQASYKSFMEPSGSVGAGIGFRIASVPEPTTLSLLALGGLLVARRRRV